MAQTQTSRTNFATAQKVALGFIMVNKDYQSNPSGDLHLCWDVIMTYYFVHVQSRIVTNNFSKLSQPKPQNVADPKMAVLCSVKQSANLF